MIGAAETRAGPAAAAASGAPAAAVVIDGLGKRYGERTVLDGVSLSIAAGELVALLGPNGAGKTTTVEIVEGYRRADSGTVRVLGLDPASAGRVLRARVGLMLQGGGIDPRAQPRETLVQYGRFHANPRDPDELLDLVGLQAVALTRFRRLSGGERQRLGLAIALVGRPEVVVLDEPTAGMDPEGRAATRAIVAGLREAGAAILLTSHDLTDVERMADRVCILNHGRVVASGRPADLANATTARLRFRLDRTIDSGRLANLEETLRQTHRYARLHPGPDGNAYWVEGGEPDAALIAAVAVWCETEGRLLSELRTDGGSLEATYLELVGGQAGGPAS